MYLQDKSSRVCYYNRQGCSLLAPANECEMGVARAALFFWQANPSGSAASGWRDLLIFYTSPFFRILETAILEHGKRISPEKAG